jgi:hypothetical protein
MGRGRGTVPRGVGAVVEAVLGELGESEIGDGVMERSRGECERVVERKSVGGRVWFGQRWSGNRLRGLSAPL